MRKTPLITSHFSSAVAKTTSSAKASTSATAWALAALLCLGGPGAFAAPAFQVMVDPGHGGTDQGATRGNVREAEIALKVALKLKEIADTQQKIKINLTRSTDRPLTLEERVRIAEKHKADVFLSIHANSAQDSRARGVEFYFQNHLSPDEETMYLASIENRFQRQLEETTDDTTKKGDVYAIIEDLKRQTRMKNSMHLSRSLDSTWGTQHSSIRQAPFYVVSKTNMPSVLVEIGFISNPKEGEKLNQPEVQAEIAQKIHAGLLRYKEKVDISRQSSLD